MTERLGVVIAAYNEKAWIRRTLEQLAAQRDADFDLIVVNNASADRTREVAQEFIAKRGLTRWRVIDEPEKGTGAAADTGIRAAIADGCTMVARTDADCLPRLDWTANIRRALTPKADGGEGLEFVTGPLVARRDEGEPAWRRALLRTAVVVASTYGRFRPINLGCEFQGPYVMAPGGNLAIRAELYERSGGFPRTRIEDVHEDHILVNRVRRVTSKYASRRDMVVAGSARRVQAWGLWNTLMWYRDHAFTSDQPDVR